MASQSENQVLRAAVKDEKTSKIDKTERGREAKHWDSASGSFDPSSRGSKSRR